MKYLILLIIFTSCFIPQKGNYYEYRNVKLREIHKTELGYDLIWEDGNSNEIMQFVSDTTGCGFRIGMMYMAMVKK